MKEVFDQGGISSSYEEDLHRTFIFPFDHQRDLGQGDRAASQEACCYEGEGGQGKSCKETLQGESC
ncbi:MAG TPA: hypothetical protein DD438_06575 [Verrucomicrobiales bacterium]|nr:hypothetical protein [Verrucomicrobiales bacterium]